MTAHPELRGRAWSAWWSAASDAWLADIFARRQGTGRAVLVAVGGYGRSELCPGSDLDLTLIHDGSDVASVRADAEAIWYPIWDAGRSLDHTVRTVREALSAADDDIKVALGLLDGRALAGDADLLEAVQAGAAEQWRQRGSRRLRALLEVIDARWARAGEVAFLLEPDLKEGRGGLRDAAALRVAAKVTPLVAFGDDTARAADELLSVRVELHRANLAAGARPADLLRLEDQDEVARRLGREDADALMADVAASARHIGWALGEARRRVLSSLAGPATRFGGRERPVTAGVRVRDGEVCVAAGWDLPADPALPLRVGEAAARLGLPIERSTLAALASATPGPGAPWAVGVRDDLVALLGTGPASIEVIETLDQHGLIVRLLPEWSAVRHRPQRNAYHRFTVDRHLCETAAGAAAFVRQVRRPDLLLLAAWLHDIGKGHGGDHVAVGEQIVSGLLVRMGLPPADVEVVARLVRHHLLLADAATRRDLDDPRTIDAVSEAVGDADTLDLLAALTEADSLATGPSAWSVWKAGLVADLVDRVRARIGGAPAPRPSRRSPPAVERDPATGVGVHVAGDVVTVAAPDRPGLLWRLAGALAVCGLDVRAARVGADESGIAVDEFDVAPALGGPIDAGRLEATIVAAVEDRLPIASRLDERTRTYARRQPRHAPSEDRPPIVLFDQAGSASSTVVEVRAPDHAGVLCAIVRALSDQGLDVVSARATTLGHEVVDVFYVQRGAAPVPPSALPALEAAVVAALEGLGG